MYKITSEAHFDAAHFLFGYNGKCRNIHGHRWVVSADISAQNLKTDPQERGMVLDFGSFKKLLKTEADRLDHSLIYEKDSLKPETLAALKAEDFALNEVDFRPTAENFAKYFFDKLSEAGFPVTRVKVYETPENCAVYEVD